MSSKMKKAQVCTNCKERKISSKYRDEAKRILCLECFNYYIDYIYSGGINLGDDDDGGFGPTSYFTHAM